MDKEILILVLEGTLRPKRRSFDAAKLVAQVGREIEGVSVKLIDPSDFNFPYDGDDDENRDPRYSELTEQADGFFIVTPEYNHGYPGSLKRMLDSEFENYHRKAVALAGVSNGGWGGTRAVEALLPVCKSLGLLPTMHGLYFPRIQDIFNEQGELQQPDYVEKVRDAFNELVWLSRALKYGRENS